MTSIEIHDAYLPQKDPQVSVAELTHNPSPLVLQVIFLCMLVFRFFNHKT